MSDGKNIRAVTDILTVLQLPEGRRVLNRILGQSHFLSASYAKGDPHGTAFNEGLRAVGLWLKSEIDKADPDAFARLLTERRM